MNFKIGDRVIVLDEDLKGEVIRVDEAEVTVLTTDGFELNFEPRELILDTDTEILKNNTLGSGHHAKVESDLKPSIRKTKMSRKKDRHVPKLEVDLHIHQLTDSVKGMSNHDILILQLDTAKRQLEFAINKRIQKVVFIHGVGEGVLRLELEYLLKRYPNVDFYEASYQKYGLGATEVHIKQNVQA